jgi:hypothetical protein
MQPRSYALGLVAAATGLIAGVVGANLLIDPQGVFGTGLVPTAFNANSRYQMFVAYKKTAGRYDGLVFGSSRAANFPLDELGWKSNSVRYASFAVNAGQITDHLPVLEYVVTQKAARREPLRAVFLLLDIDNFKARSVTNRFIQTMLAPEVSGESAARFWWKNLTAIQFRAWRNSLQQIGRDSQTAPRAVAAEIAAQAVDRRSEGADFAQQLRILDRFVSLCRERGIALIVATSPLSGLNAAGRDPRELSDTVERISRIVPVWDFTQSDWLADQPQLWYDDLHFEPEVGRMMLARIFGDAMPPEWADFGRLVRPPSSATAP